jgi:hypothetical protein
MESEFALKRVFRSTVIITGALIAGLFVYAVFVEIVKSRLKPFAGFLPQTPLQSLRYVFYGAAVGAVVLVRLAAKTLTRRAPGEGALPFGQRLGRAAVVTAALAEIPAVLGFVLFILSGFSRDFYALLFASLFLEFIYFPRFKVWQDLFKENILPEGN